MAEIYRKNNKNVKTRSDFNEWAELTNRTGTIIMALSAHKTPLNPINSRALEDYELIYKSPDIKYVVHRFIEEINSFADSNVRFIDSIGLRELYDSIISRDRTERLNTIKNKMQNQQHIVIKTGRNAKKDRKHGVEDFAKFVEITNKVKEGQAKSREDIDKITADCGLDKEKFRRLSLITAPKSRSPTTLGSKYDKRKSMSLGSLFDEDDSEKFTDRYYDHASCSSFEDPSERCVDNFARDIADGTKSTQSRQIIAINNKLKADGRDFNRNIFGTYQVVASSSTDET